MKSATRLLTKFAVVATIATSLAPTSGSAQQSSYYKPGYAPLFNPFPEDTGRGASKPWRIRYFGPVGIGIDLKRPGMTMEINNIEEGSPAAKTGKLKKGQIIESINGTTLKDIDPREILGDIITKAEATDGKINLAIKGEGNVLVQIPVMGPYSPTWPVNCPKSDKIVRNLADILAKLETPTWGSVLFMLSTGEEKDLAVVKKWMTGIDTIGGMNWEKGYKGIGLCEYYLRTGDQTMLPVIKKMTEELKDNIYNGGWSGRGKPAAFTYSTGTGQVHASGMHCMTFLVMARLCGVDVDEYTFNTSLKQFYRFGGRGNVAYGNGLPEGGLRDNGKTSGLALAMAAAAQLTPEGENSVYAKARDNAAIKSFYATNWFHAAHTGGGMGEIWHHGAIALMREKRPTPYRSYLDTRRWVMDLSRRHDGSIAIEGMDDRYNRSVTDGGTMDWGTFFALTYTYPRKALQLWGAPRSKWAKQFQLPPRPWGNPADDIFNSPDPVQGGSDVQLTMQDLLNERVETDSSVPFFAKLRDPKTPESWLLKYLLHPEEAFRTEVAVEIVKRDLTHLVVPLLSAEDPRLRLAGLMTLTGMFKGRAFADDKLTPEMFDLVGKMIDDPNESWWVAMHAIKAINRADAARVGKHRDRLLEFLKYDSVWVQTEAVITLCKIASEPAHYKVVLPAIIDTASSITVDSSSYQSTRALQNALRSASPEVKTFASPLLKKVYANFPKELADPHTGTVMNRGATTVRSRLGSIVEVLPGGPEFVNQIPKTTVASYISGKDSDKYSYGGKFTPNPKLVGTWKWAVYPPPKNPGEADAVITKWLEPRLKKGLPIQVENKDILQLLDGGKVAKSRYFGGHFWSGDHIISNNAGHALKMEIKTYNGIDCLLIEQANFGGGPDDEGTAEVPKDFHPGYSVYLRADGKQAK